MKKIKFLLVVVLIWAFHQTSFSQGALSLRINEVMINNDSTLVDNYGNRSGWIEIFNTNYYSVNIGGMYITNDTANPKMYSISKIDPNTTIPQRGFYILYADNKPYRGTQHLNFELDDSDYIAIFDADGKTLLDLFVIPDEIKNLRDKSYGRLIDGEEEFGILSRYTPNNPNDWVEKVSKSQEIARIDPSGTGMILIAMTVVFSCLILIFFLLKGFQLLSKYGLLKDSPSHGHGGHSPAPKKEETKVVATPEHNDTSGEVCAAIGLALHLYANQFHDEESEIITIDHTKRSYSPWGNKHLVMKRNSIKR